MAEKLNYTGAPEVAAQHDMNARWNVHASPEAFGVGVFDEIHGLGEKGVEAAIRRQGLVNDIDHNNRALDTSQEFNKEWENMAGKQGMAAHDYLPTYQANMRTIYNKAIEDAPNPVLKKQLANTLYRDADRWMSHGSNYAGTQLRQAHHEVHTRALEQNANSVEMMRNQPNEEIIHQAEHGTGGVGGLNSVRERLLNNGISPYNKDGSVNEANMATYKAEEAKQMSATVGPTIISLADNWENKPSDLYKAKDLFDKVRDRLDARTANAIEQRLIPRLDKAFVQDEADKHIPIPDESGYYPTTANEQKRLELSAAPTRENAARVSGQQPSAQASPAGIAHPSEHFAHLESGGKGLSYINEKDTDGSHSYGNLGLNSNHAPMTSVWTTSAGKFWLKNKHLGLEGTPGTPKADESWRKVAAQRGPELREAEKKFWEDQYLNPVVPGLKKSGVPESIYNSKKVQFYLADRNVQQGSGKMLDSKGEAGSHSERFAEAARRAGGDPNKFISELHKLDTENLEHDFPKATAQGIYDKRGNEGRLSGRAEAAAKASGEAVTGEARPQPTPGGQPPDAQHGGPLSPQQGMVSPGMGTRNAVHQSNLIAARAASGGNPVRERMLYNELNRRSTLLKNNLAGERARIDGIMKNVDLQVSKGMPNVRMEDFGITEDQIRQAHADKPWVAEHIIESFHLQAQNADKLSSMKFAPKAEWDAYLANMSQGLGVDTMVQAHRGEKGTKSAFDYGSDPEAKGEIMTNDFALRERIAKTVSKAHADHFAEMNKDPVAYLNTNKNPSVAKAMAEANNKDLSPFERSSAFRRYASTVVSEQKQMGVPDDKVRVLSNQKAEELAKSVMDSPDPKGTLDAMKLNYGDLFNPVFKDVINQGKLPSKFEALTELDNQNAVLLAGSIKSEAAAKGNEHRRQIDSIIGPQERAKLTSAIRDGMKDFSTSLKNRGVSDPGIAEAINTAVMLGEQRMMTFKESSSAAAAESVKAFTGKYKFTADNLAIPADKHDAVKGEMSEKLRFLDPKTIQVPAAITGLGHDASRYVRDVRSLGRWKATPDGDGAYLVDFAGRPVMQMVPGTKAAVGGVTQTPTGEAYDPAAEKTKDVPDKYELIQLRYSDLHGSLFHSRPPMFKTHGFRE